MLTLGIVVGVMLTLVAITAWAVLGGDSEEGLRRKAQAELFMHAVQTQFEATQVKADIRATGTRMRQELDRELRAMDEQREPFDFRGIHEYLERRS